jgi:hypothetical protein
MSFFMRVVGDLFPLHVRSNKRIPEPEIMKIDMMRFTQIDYKNYSPQFLKTLLHITLIFIQILQYNLKLFLTILS